MPDPIAFPYITPSSRVYSPGEYPSEDFVSQNGSTTHVRYGNRRSGSRLSLGFQNITDDEAYQILQCYKRVQENWHYVRFNRGDDGDGGKGGAWEGVQPYIDIENDPNRERKLITHWYQENFPDASGTYWRFASPPTVTSTFPNRCTVQCEFVSYLDA